MDEKVKAMVDEFLKSKDVEKLSKDDLDNISGGVMSDSERKILQLYVEDAKKKGLTLEEFLSGFTIPDITIPGPGGGIKFFDYCSKAEVIQYLKSIW